MKIVLLILPLVVSSITAQAPPFLLQTTPVAKIPFYYPRLENISSCEGLNEAEATYRPWPSHFITPTELPTDNINFTSRSVIFLDPKNYPVPETPIRCFSSSQLRNGSCTSFYNCIYTMNGTINPAPECPGNMYCCMLPTCALVIGSQTRTGHCRPARTCPGIFDQVMGVSVGCPDPINAPCCVTEEVSVQCPRNYDKYVDALVKSYGLLNVSTNAVATPQRVVAWAPFLLSVFDDTVGMCVNDCHKTSFMQFFMNIMSEMFMFTNGTTSLYKRLVDWKGKSMGLLPGEYFSIYSPYVFSHVMRYLFENYDLSQLYGRRSYLSAARIIDFLNQQIGSQLKPDYTSQFTLYAWQSYKYFASFSDCAPIFTDGAECSQGQGICAIARMSHVMNISEYWRFCPRQLPLQYGDCIGYPVNVVCCVKPYPPLKYGANLVKSEFNDVIIAVHQAHFKDPSLIEDLIKVFTNASAALYKATRGRAYFRTITILSHWNNTHGNATYENFRDSDIKVVPEITDEPRMLHLGTCGEPGMGVFLSQNHLRHYGAGQTLAKLFAMNRWGFGDEVPSTINEILYVPDDRYQGTASLRAGSACSVNMKVEYQPTFNSASNFNLTILNPNPYSVGSFAFRPDLFPQANSEFCATTTIPHCDDTRRHNTEPNTPHNRLCNRTSTLETILRSMDFDQTQNSPRFVGNTNPTFKFVAYNPITTTVLVLVCDFSGSVPPPITSVMLNAIIGFLQVAPDEIPIVLVNVGPDRDVVIQPNEPTSPQQPFQWPTGSLFRGRQRLIETAKSWLHRIRPVLNAKNTSILSGVEAVVNRFLPRKDLRLRILVISDFLGIAPSDNGLMLRIREAGYSLWPVAITFPDQLIRLAVTNVNLVYTIRHTWFPLYYYMQSIANSTYGRWQYIQDTSNMTHWYYAMATFLDDNNLGTAIYIDSFLVKNSDTVSFNVRIPPNYGLNTTMIVDHDALLIPVTVTASFSRNCVRDDRGFQRTFRLICQLNQNSNVAENVTLSFGRDSQLFLPSTDARLAASKNVNVMILSRAVEHGSAYTGDNYVPKPWVDPWVNRIALAPDRYPKAEARLTHGSEYVFERSSKFIYPRVYAIVYQGRHALLGCQVEYDLYYVNYTVLSLASPTARPVPTRSVLVNSGRLFDDGLLDDGFANDGVYTALLTNAVLNGTYTVWVKIRQGTPACQMKRGVALVGHPNDPAAVAAAPAESVPMYFYKVAGSFNIIVPPDASNVFPLGTIEMIGCGLREVNAPKNFSVNEFYKLPQNFIIFCNVAPLYVKQRFNFTLTYNLAISVEVKDFTFKNRYWSNATFLASTTSSNSVVDGKPAITMEVTMKPDVVAPVYYAVAWATDGRDNYATRSQIQAIVVPTFYNNASGSLTELPLFTDITTPSPRPDDVWPDAIIYSCVGGGAFACLLVVVAIGCFACRRPSRRLLVPRRPPYPAYGHVDDNRLSIVGPPSSRRSASVPLAPPSRMSKHSTLTTSTLPPYPTLPPPVGKRKMAAPPPPPPPPPPQFYDQNNMYATNLMDTADRQNFQNYHRYHQHHHHHHHQQQQQPPSGKHYQRNGMMF